MFKKKKMKAPFVVVLSFSRRTVAEIAKNTLCDKQILDKNLIREKSKFVGNDFTFFNFVNDDNKVYRVIFQVLMKEKEKSKKKLFSELKYMFDCSDIEIVHKQDFDFSKYNLRNPLVRGEINNVSSEAIFLEQQNNVNKQISINNNEVDANNKNDFVKNIASVANEKYIEKSFGETPVNQNPINNVNLQKDIQSQQVQVQQLQPQQNENSNIVAPSNVLTLEPTNLNGNNNIAKVQLSEPVPQSVTPTQQVNVSEIKYNKDNPFE